MQRLQSLGFVWLWSALAVLGCGDDAETGSPGLEPSEEAQDGGGALGEDAGQTGGSGGSSGSPAPAGDAGGMNAMPRSDAGSAPADSPTCEPSAETLTPQDRVGVGESCGGTTSEESLLPNLDDAFIEDLPLTTPLEPGQPFAISISPTRSTSAGSLEIWGSEQGCGPVDELLWFGDMEGRSMCVELMPTRPHSRLQFVSRRLDPLRGLFRAGPGTVVLCPTGSCPGGSDGHPLAPGVVLDPPEGVYDVTCSGSGDQYECTSVGISGRILLFHDEGRTDERSDTFWPVSSGAFRMPATDPFGDAWYCVGGGSEVEESEDGSRTDLRLRDVTRMPACSEGSESASFDWRPGMRTGIEIRSSLAEIAGTELAITQHCAGDACKFRFARGLVNTYLYVTFGAPGSGATAPTERPVVDAHWFIAPVDGLPVRRACTTSGTVQQDPSGTNTLQLDNLSTLVACPGEPIENDSVDIVGQ